MVGFAPVRQPTTASSRLANLAIFNHSLSAKALELSLVFLTCKRLMRGRKDVYVTKEGAG